MPRSSLTPGVVDRFPVQLGHVDHGKQMHIRSSAVRQPAVCRDDYGLQRRLTDFLGRRSDFSESHMASSFRKRPNRLLAWRRRHPPLPPSARYLAVCFFAAPALRLHHFTRTTHQPSSSAMVISANAVVSVPHLAHLHTPDSLVHTTMNSFPPFGISFTFRHKTGRHRPPKDSPYTKPAGAGKSLSSRISDGPGGSSQSGRGGRRGSANLNPRRQPEGTPDVLKDRNPKRAQVQQQQHSKYNEVLKTDGFKAWMQSRQIAPGVLDMSVSTRVAVNSKSHTDDFLLEPRRGQLPQGAGNSAARRQGCSTQRWPCPLEDGLEHPRVPGQPYPHPVSCP